jgi:hypothetical protein
VIQLESVKGSFDINLLGSHFETQHASMNFIIKSGIPDHFWTQKLLNKHHVLTKGQLSTTVARLEYMPWKILKQL